MVETGNSTAASGDTVAGGIRRAANDFAWRKRRDIMTGMISHVVLWRAAASSLTIGRKRYIDKVSIARFARHLEQNLTKLVKNPESDAYRPMPLRRHYIEKAPGRFRPLGIPAVRDRVAQEIIRQLIEPLFEPYFSTFS